MLRLIYDCTFNSACLAFLDLYLVGYLYYIIYKQITNKEKSTSFFL